MLSWRGGSPSVFSISLSLLVYLYTDNFRRWPESCYVNESSSRSLQSSLAAIVLETSTLMEGTKTGDCSLYMRPHVLQYSCMLLVS